MLDAIQELNISNWYGGLNTVDSPHSIAPNQALKLTNFTFGDGNMIEIRKGTTLLRDMRNNNPIRGIYRYSDNAGHNYNLWLHDGYFLQDDGADADDETDYTYEFQGTATASGTPEYNATAEPSWEQYNNLVYISNGVNEQSVYRRAAWANTRNLRRTGVPIPDAMTYTAVTATGGSLEAGVYKFLFTLELADGVIVEGNPDSTGTAISVTAAQDNSISVTVSNPDSSGIYTYLNWYVTDVGGDIFYYWKSTTLDDSSTYTETLSAYTELSTDEEDEVQVDNYRPPIGTVNRRFNNTMFIGGVSANPSYLYASKWNRYEQFPGNLTGGDPVSSEYLIDIEDHFVGMERAANGGLVILCRSSIQLLTGTDSTTWRRQYISDSVGCISARHICVGTDKLIYFQSLDGIYATDGNQIYLISRNIWDKFSSLTFAQLIKGCLFYHRKRLYVQYCNTNASTTADRTLEFDTRYQDSSTGQLGAWVGPHDGVYVNCFTQSKKEDESYAYIGANNTGKIYRYNYGNADATGDVTPVAITAEANSGYLYIGGPVLIKRFFNFFADCKPTSALPQCTLLFDAGGSTQKVVNVPLTRSISGDTWSNTTWGGGKWGSGAYFPIIKDLTQPSQGSSLQIKIYCKAQSPAGVKDRNFAVRALGLGYEVLRHRRG